MTIDDEKTMIISSANIKMFQSFTSYSCLTPTVQQMPIEPTIFLFASRFFDFPHNSFKCQPLIILLLAYFNNFKKLSVQKWDQVE